jgi:nitrite reductase/ring-hydroxylating ferredoxin subunit
MKSENSSNETKSDDSPSGASLYHVMSVDRINEEGRVLVEVRGKNIAIFRLDDEYYAIQDFCVHQGGPMCKGADIRPRYLESTKTETGWQLSQNQDVPTVACPWHGWEYNLETGDHVAPTGYTLRTYPVIVKEEELYIRV